MARSKAKRGKAKSAVRKSGSSRTSKAATPARKKTSKKKAARKSGRTSLAPKPVKTGAGASPAAVGGEFVALFNAGSIGEIEERLWSPRVVSVEGHGVSMAWHGRKAVRAKNEEWMATHQIHEARAEGPYVGASGFAVKFAMDVEDTTNGTRHPMQEIGVYTIERGKIVREEFMYGG
jgi:hypothetical protein